MRDLIELAREPLALRASARRKELNLSFRQMGEETGVAFSTLARVLSGKGAFNRESARKVGAWLGDDVSEIISARDVRLAEELGRKIARAFEAEVIAITARAIAGEGE